MANPPASTVSKDDYERAVRQAADPGLFSVGGPFEHFPGAVLLAGPNGMVLGANRAAEAIADRLRGGSCQDLRVAIEAALNGRAAQVNPLLLPSGTPETSAGGQAQTGPNGGPNGGMGRAFDVAVLPWCNGTAALLLGRDITLERSLRAALIESRQRYKDLIEATCDFAWETDAQGRFVFISPQGALGHAAAELVGASAPDLLIDYVEGQDSPFTTRSPVHDVEVWLRGSDGEAACVLATGLPLAGRDGAWCGARGLCRNITKARSHEAELASDRHRERLLAYVLGIVRDEMEPGSMMTAAAGALVPALPATGVCIYRRERSGELGCAAQAGELPPKDSLEPILWRAVVEQSKNEFETAIEGGTLFAMVTRFQDGRNGVLCIWRHGEAQPWRNEDRSLLNEVAVQVGLAVQQLDRQEELEELSSTDSLTGLLNRRSFMAEVEKRYVRQPDRRGGAALIFIDLDNFKAVNDVRGHQEGDMALTTLARILREQVRGRDLAARLGGDEFALFIEDITPAAAEHKARDLLRAGEELSVYSGGPEAPLGLSIGVAACDTTGQERLDELIERADQAMYRVKRRGKGGVELSRGTEPQNAC